MKSLLSAAIFTLLTAAASHGASLELAKAPGREASSPPLQAEGQIPQSRVAHGDGIIALVWLSSPTGRYDHGVLGDAIEAAALTLVLRDGTPLRYELPASRVFEDLQPRLVNLDGEGADEIVVVETDVRLGASLAVYGIRQGAVEKMAATPFLGRSHRWLNPTGAGDFDGDGVMDLALVATPHIGGVLELYSYTPPQLAPYARYRGVSTHSIGSTALGMGTVVQGREKDLILAPTQRHDALLLLEWVEGKIEEKARAALPAPMEGDLVPAGENRWTFRLENGSHYSVKANP